MGSVGGGCRECRGGKVKKKRDMSVSMVASCVPCAGVRVGAAARRPERRCWGSTRTRRVVRAGAEGEYTEVVQVSPAQQAVPQLAAYRSGGSSGGAFGFGVVVGAVGCYVLTGEAAWAQRLRNMAGMKAKSGLSKAAQAAEASAAKAGKKVADVSGDVYNKAKAANPELIDGVEKVAGVTGKVAGTAAKAAGSAAKATLDEVKDYAEYKKSKGAQSSEEQA